MDYIQTGAQSRMFRSNTMYPKSKTINLMLLDGGLGDHVAALTTVRYIIQTYPWLKPLIWVPDYLLELTKSVLPKAEVMSFSEMKGRYDPSKPTKTTKWDGNISPMKIHLVDYAFLKLCDENPSIEHKNYVKLHNPVSTEHLVNIINYVVITIGYTASVREFPANEVNKIVKYLVSNGVTPVFLGQTNTKTGAAHDIIGNFDNKVDLTKGIDLIDKTNLLEAWSIMSRAKAVIGVDNGLLHLAGMTDVPIVGGFTTVNPELRMPIRNNILGHNYFTVVPDEDLKCKFCQVKTNFLYGHNYVNCYYKDNLCTKQMTADKFINHLSRLI